MNDEESAYQAMVSRDRRFDGLFYVAVRTTGIYCRPVCPARKPLRKNCHFFRYAEQAEKSRLPALPEMPAGTCPWPRAHRPGRVSVPAIHRRY